MGYLFFRVAGVKNSLSFNYVQSIEKFFVIEKVRTTNFLVIS